MKCTGIPQVNLLKGWNFMNYNVTHCGQLLYLPSNGKCTRYGMPEHLQLDTGNAYVEVL